MDNPQLKLGFSISATSRQPRGTEKNGIEYYFISADEFRRRVAAGEFIEWEEVYAGTFYGTPTSEIERVTSTGRNLVLDIDVKGGVNVKKQFGSAALSIFIMPPNLKELEQRLRNRGTDSPQMIARRLAKAEYEIGFSGQYDTVVINDDLDTAVRQITNIIKQFIS